jgi:hypothetical protein
VLDPARARQDLLVLELVARHLGAVVIEQHAARAGRPLVDRGDELTHVGFLLLVRPGPALAVRSP